MKCKDCKHGSEVEYRRPLLNCDLALDANDFIDNDPSLPLDRVLGWDGEGYSAGVYVGPEFGCIHFSPKDPTC